ncbi:MAG: hypothetical protein ACXVH0_08730, partial [Thermoanaerobaculia bacterium]
MAAEAPFTEHIRVTGPNGGDSLRTLKIVISSPSGRLRTLEIWSRQPSECRSLARQEFRRIAMANSVEEKVKGIIVEQLGVQADEVKPEA